MVNDGADPATDAVAAPPRRARRRARRARGASTPRATPASQPRRAELVVLIDDDVAAPAGWLDALLAAAPRRPTRDVFGGPIRAALEGGGPRSCGREAPPITTLDLGPADRDVAARLGRQHGAPPRARWSGSGRFDEAIARPRRRGGLGAALHGDRRRGALRRGRRSRASPQRRPTRACAPSRAPPTAGAAPPAATTCARAPRPRWRPSCARCRAAAGTSLRRRCPNGIVLAAHSRRAAARGAGGDGTRRQRRDFLSGTSGQRAGARATRGRGGRAARRAPRRARCSRGGCAARPRDAPPRRRVLALGSSAPTRRTAGARRAPELRRSRHDVELATHATSAARGKFENLNALLAAHPLAGHDWLLVIDDDVALPHGFLDAFLFLAERFDLRARAAGAPPPLARRLGGHPPPRRAASCARRAFVEIGPVSALPRPTRSRRCCRSRSCACRLGARRRTGRRVAREHGWRIGVVDATPIRHVLRPIAASYGRGDALAEARDVPRRAPVLTAGEAQRTLADPPHW